MTFLLRRPGIFIPVTVIAVLVLVYFSGILTPAPRGLVIDSARFTGSDAIALGENTTLTVVLKNWADEPQTFELHIVFTGNLTFYDGITKERLTDITQRDIYYNLTYPTRGTLDMQGSTSIPIVAEGRELSVLSQTYTLFVALFSREGSLWKFADQTPVQLTVTQP